jgi:hypothetical protein
VVGFVSVCVLVLSQPVWLCAKKAGVAGFFIQICELKSLAPNACSFYPTHPIRKQQKQKQSDRHPDSEGQGVYGFARGTFVAHEVKQSRS